MGADGVLHVEVVFARPNRQDVVSLQVNPGTTALEAVMRSAVLSGLPEFAARDPELGIFGRRIAADTALSDGDRVEIYRPLTADPKQARRQRAQNTKN